MYITQANLGKLISQIEIDVSNLLTIPHIQNFISQNDLIKLSRYEKFFSTDDKISLTYLNKVSVPNDTYTMVFEGVKPAYHLNKYCPKLNNNYNNLYIPAEIKSRGHAEVERFRNYVKKFSPSEWESDATFLTIKAEFGFTDPHFTTVQRDNSGAQEIDFTNLALNDIENILKTTIQQLEGFSQQSSCHKKVFQLIYRTPKDIKTLTKNHNPETAQLAIELANLKDKLLLAQIAFFQKSANFNPENLSVDLLESNGFIPCSCTKSKQQTNDRGIRLWQV